jgi:hypothetical protein
VGISTNLINQGAVLQSLLLVGSVSVVFAYLQRYKDAEEKRSAILTISFLLPALATTIFYLPYLSLSLRMQKNMHVKQLSWQENLITPR